MKKIIKKLKKIWKNDFKDVLVPIISIMILILATITIGFVLALVIFVLINVIYFAPRFFNRKKKGKKKLSKKQKKIKSKKRLKVFFLIILAGFIFGVISVIGFFAYIVINAPEFDEELLYVSEPSLLLDKDGEEIGKLGTDKLVKIEYDEIPEVLIDAIVATEDSRFFTHNGVDWARFLKATFYQLLGRSEAGGASTLTMQVSKNRYTNDTASGIEGIIRKFTDVYVATFILEKKYTKEQILTFYVNSQWLAKHTLGVEQTSLTYFGKSAKDLNLAEAAMIAGLFQAPGRYDPYVNPEATEKRRQTVLNLMLRHGYITQDEYDIAMKMTVDKIVIPIEESSYSSSALSKYQSFIDTVVEEVTDKTGKNPYTTPMTIYTTMDTGFQDYINGIMSGESYDWENDEVQAGIAVINVKDGSVSAIGGNRKITTVDTYNYATDIKNQIGSTAKPLYDYGPAIEYNNWSSYNIVVDEPTTYSDGTKINNWNGAFEGFETIRIALRGSRNIPALKTFKKNDKSKVVEFVTNLGLSPEICNKGYEYNRDTKMCIKRDPDTKEIIEQVAHNTTLHEAHAIGGYNGESPLTLASAYAAFANKGIYTKPYTFTKVVFQQTGEEFVNDIEKTKAMSEETAYIITDMLITTAPNAVGSHYNINGIKYAAKTGTTNFTDDDMKKYNMKSNAVNDLWTVGFNTEYAIGVWYGYKDATSEHHNVLSSGQHNRLFQAVGKKVFTNKDGFTMPSGVVAVEVESGCPDATLPSEFTPSDLRQTELFIKGTEPTNVSNRFAKLSDVSNLKADVKDGTVTLKWDSVSTPNINNPDYLKQYFSKVFENESYLNAYVQSRIDYNNANIGVLGYNVYLKDKSGNLTLLEFVSTNTYKTTFEVSGDYTFVVKTAYSIFKNNMSDGKLITVNISTSSPIVPDDPDEPKKPTPGESENPSEETQP